jgi:hypothetical protein
MIRDVRSDHDRTRSPSFTMGVAFAITACALCSVLNIAARAPIAPMLLLEIVSGVFCIVALAIRLRTPVHRWIPLFAGSVFGLTLSVAVAAMSQSNDLTPGMALLPPYSTSSGFSAEVLYGKPRPVRPLPLQTHPRSFLSRTHEIATITPSRSP